MWNGQKIWVLRTPSCFLQVRKFRKGFDVKELEKNISQTCFTAIFFPCEWCLGVSGVFLSLCSWSREVQLQPLLWSLTSSSAWKPGIGPLGFREIEFNTDFIELLLLDLFSFHLLSLSLAGSLMWNSWSVVPPAAVWWQQHFSPWLLWAVRDAELHLPEQHGVS